MHPSRFRAALNYHNFITERNRGCGLRSGLIGSEGRLGDVHVDGFGAACRLHRFPGGSFGRNANRCRRFQYHRDCHGYSFRPDFEFHTAVDRNAATTTLKLSPANLTVGAGVGAALTGSFTASGGVAPYKFSATGLPAGVTLSSGGAVGGSSGSPGTFSSTVTVTDAESTPASATAQLTVQILGLTTSALPAGAATVLYTGSFTAAGGNPPYAYSANGLPSGLALSGSGTLSGTPTTPGPVSFSVQVSDSSGLSTATPYTLTIQKAPVSVKTSGLTGGAVGTPYSQALNAAGGTAPYAWSLLTGVLPPGLSLASSGTISGTPTKPGTSSFGVQAMDTSGGVASASVSIAIAPSPITITSGSFPAGISNFGYPSQILGASGGVAPYTFSVTGGGLPPGIALSSRVISGTPTTTGTFP